MNSSTALPLSWREVKQRYAESTSSALEYEQGFASEFSSCEEVELVDAFAGSDALLARGLALLGKTACELTMKRWCMILPQVTTTMKQHQMLGELLSHEVLNFALVAECAGFIRPTNLGTDSLQALLSERHTFSDVQLRSMAWSALAMGEMTRAYEFLQADPPTDPVPGETFEFNQFDLIRYLAHALAERRPSDWVDAAWLEYLELFPCHLAADAGAWPDLFCAARVMAQLRNEPVATVADDLHARVALLANDTQ